MFGFIKELGKIDVEYNGLPVEETEAASHQTARSYNFKSYVKNIESDYLIIDFLFYKGAEYNIPNGKPITVKFKEKSGIYAGKCTVLGYDNSKLPGIKISYPTDIKFVQQREYVRVPLKLKAELVIFDETEVDDIQVEEIQLLDISGSGFSYVSEKPVKKHSKIIGIINLTNPAEKPIEILVKHVYSRTFIPAGKEMYKNAFTFEDLDEKSREKILKEIFLYELGQRKKGI